MNFKQLIPDTYIDKVKSSDALKSQFEYRDIEQASLQEEGLVDPIADQAFQVTPNLIHRYKNRALFLPTNHCPIHCRYCFRRNELETNHFKAKDFDKTISYLSEHSEIEELIFTGGDPFVLSDTKLMSYLNQLPSSIKYIRFHSRMPVVTPDRFNQNFFSFWEAMKTQFTRFNLVLHTNHLDEFSNEANKVLYRFGHFYTQSVLLKDVNDDSKALSALFHHIIDLGGTPYYLHHPDKVKGGMHFQIEQEIGKQIMQELRAELPGWAIPTYILDSSDGSGKKALN
jgi:lysine 2,3-aminomutase